MEWVTVADWHISYQALYEGRVNLIFTGLDRLQSNGCFVEQFGCFVIHLVTVRTSPGEAQALSCSWIRIYFSRAHSFVRPFHPSRAGLSHATEKIIWPASIWHSRAWTLPRHGGLTHPIRCDRVLRLANDQRLASALLCSLHCKYKQLHRLLSICPQVLFWKKKKKKIKQKFKY